MLNTRVRLSCFIRFSSRFWGLAAGRGRHQSRRASDLSVLARQRKGWFSVGSTIFAGIDRTSGDSGAFGINKALVITMLFRLEKVG